MEEVTYYVVAAKGSFDVPANLFSRPTKDGYYVSPNGRLCGDMGMATVLVPALAERLRRLAIDRLRSPCGPGLQLEVLRVRASGLGKMGIAKVQKSSEKTLAWCEKQEAI